MLKPKKMPKIYTFRTKKDKQPYIIEKEHVADEFVAALSEIYNRMDGSDILKKGQKYTVREVPWGYFRYDKKIWPVYADDAGQCDYIYINGESCSSGSYNFDPIEEFISMIEYHKKKEEK